MKKTGNIGILVVAQHRGNISKKKNKYQYCFMEICKFLFLEVFLFLELFPVKSIYCKNILILRITS